MCRFNFPLVMILYYNDFIYMRYHARFLNDFNSPACQQCVRFVANIDLESLVSPDPKEGFKPMLAHLAQVFLIPCVTPVVDLVDLLCLLFVVFNISWRAFFVFIFRFQFSFFIFHYLLILNMFF